MKACCKKAVAEYKKGLIKYMSAGEGKEEVEEEAPVVRQDYRFAQWSKITNKDEVKELLDYYLGLLKQRVGVENVTLSHRQVMKLDAIVSISDGKGGAFSLEEIKEGIQITVNKKGISHLNFLENDLLQTRMKKQTGRIFQGGKGGNKEVYNALGEAMEKAVEEFRRTGIVMIAETSEEVFVKGGGSAQVFAEIATNNFEWESVLDKHGIVYMETINA